VIMAWTGDYGPDGAVIRFSGNVTGAEIAEAKAKFFAHRFPGAARYALCDFTAVEKFDVSAADVQRIIDQDRGAVRTHPDLNEVVVAPRPGIYGLSRMWEQQVDAADRRTAVVKTRPEADRWLADHGITPVTPPSREEAS
jgi:hypothetical protein